MRFVLVLGFLLCGERVSRADPADDLARIHLHAIGGRERLDALAAMRATGHVEAAGKQVRFTMIAARPNRLRLETEKDGRSLIQVTNGVDPAWEWDTGTWPPQHKPLRENIAKLFTGDAEFDDPLVAGAERGFTLDLAGTIDASGKNLLRILVTRNLTETFSLLLDDATYFIVMRVEHRTSIGGRKTQIVTHYEDFRPVSGVLLPHRLILAVDGRVSQKTTITRVEANPTLSDETFSQPKSALTR